VQAVRDTIVKEITAKLQLRLTGSEQARLTEPYTPNAEAYLLYQRGHFYWRQAGEAELRTALRYFQQAVEKDPNYAAAWAGVAKSSSGLANHAPPREMIPQAKKAIARALQLDEQEDDAHRVAAVLFLFFERDVLAAEQALRQAERLSPRSGRTNH